MLSYNSDNMEITKEVKKIRKCIVSPKIVDELEAQMQKEEVWKPVEGELNYYTSMNYWLPRVSSLKEIRTPKTIAVQVPDDCDLFHLLDYGTKHYQEPLHYQEFLLSLEKAVKDIGTPCFFRSAYTSDKHGWVHSCYIDNMEEIESHLFQIVNLSGLADLPVDAFYVRELIPTSLIFTFFEDMPITREFRFKLEGNDITHVQPYWPDEAFEKYDLALYTSDKREALRSISVLQTSEFFYLKEMTLKLREVLPEFNWSVDWLQDKNGNWWLTDIARAEHSYWWEPDFKVVQD